MPRPDPERGVDPGQRLSLPLPPLLLEQLAGLGIETVNLGGNEPLFTNGPDPAAALLPYIIHSLADAGILVGITTSGITVTHPHREHPDAFARVNDVDVSPPRRPAQDQHPQARRARGHPRLRRPPPDHHLPGRVRGPRLPAPRARHGPSRPVRPRPLLPPGHRPGPVVPDGGRAGPQRPAPGPQGLPVHLDRRAKIPTDVPWVTWNPPRLRHRPQRSRHPCGWRCSTSAGTSP